MKRKLLGFLIVSLFCCFTFLFVACNGVTTGTTASTTAAATTTNVTTTGVTTAAATTTAITTMPTTVTTTVVTTTTIPVDSVSVVGSDSVEVDDTSAYTAIYLPTTAASAADVVWSVVAGTGSATITSAGILTAVEPGTVSVVASVKGVEGSIEVTITQSVDSAAISGPEVVDLGSEANYLFTVDPANATYEEVIWAVLAGTGSATITQEGVLTPVVAGTVTVRVSVDSVIATKAVTITTPVAEVSVNGDDIVRLEDTPTFTTTILPIDADYDAVIWSVVDGTGSASIDASGVLTPISAGIVTVVASADDIEGEFEVELIVSVSSIVLSGEVSILPGDHPTYTAEVLPAGAKYGTVTWTVVDGTGSATITNGGVLSPISSGTITVVATADGVAEEFIVTINPDDRLLGTPRPTHLLATPENTITIESVWEPQTDLEGLSVEFAREVYDISFTADASRSSEGVEFKVPNSVDLGRMQYFAIKVTGATQTEGVNPTISVQLRDFDSGLNLFNDQVTEIEITASNQWVVFGISNRYRLQTESRDLRILVDPHYTASGNEGFLTIQQVVFFGNANPVTEPALLTPLKNAHWEDTGVTAEPAVDTIDDAQVDVLRISATAAAVSGWKAIPAYVLEDISRATTISFKVKLLTPDLLANPRLLVTLGDTDLTNVTITRPAVGVDPVYQTVTVTIPAAMRTEANMWAARYIQLKANTGGTAEAVEYFIYDFKLSGDANPTPITVTRLPLGGANVLFTSAPSYIENGTQVLVAATVDEEAHRLWTPTVDATLSKLQYGYTKSSANLAARSGMNGIYVKIQGTPGLEINLQQNWGDSWADESQRRFVLDGTVQEIFILATTRTLITSGTSGTVSWQFNATIPTGTEGAAIKVFTVAFTAILPTPETIKEMDISFGRFIEGGNTLVMIEDVETDTMTVAYADNHAVATVQVNNAANHLVSIASSSEIRYMNTLTIQLKGAIGTKVTVKLAYGNAFNMDVDYVHTFTTDDVETIVIDIQDRDQLKVSKISLELLFDLDVVTAPVNFEVVEAHFSGIIPSE